MQWRLKTVPRVTVTRVPTGNAALSIAMRESRSCSSAPDTERRMLEESVIALHDRHFRPIPQKLWTVVLPHPAALVPPGLHSLVMAFHRRIDSEPVGTSGGTEELRPARNTTELATGTMACPECDAPVMPAGPVRPADPIGCPFCGTAGAVRDFLSLEDPSRPARVVVRVVLR